MHVGPQCTFSLCQCRSRKKWLYGRPTDTILNTYVHNIRCIAVNPYSQRDSEIPVRYRDNKDLNPESQDWENWSWILAILNLD